MKKLFKLKKTHLNIMESIYFDYLPDDIILYHIIKVLSKNDSGSLLILKNFESRDTLLSNYILLTYPKLHVKKSWYPQTWYEFLLRIISFDILPIVQDGDPIDYIPYLKSDELSYIVNPNGSTTDKVLAFLSIVPGFPDVSYSTTSSQRDVMHKYAVSYSTTLPQRDVMNKYAVSMIVIVKDGIITDIYYPRKGLGFFAAVIIDNSDILPYIQEGSIPQNPSGRKSEIKLKKVPHNKFALEGQIWNKLFSPLASVPIYGYSNCEGDIYCSWRLIDYTKSRHDLRFTSKGKVCETFQKDELLRILSMFGIKADPKLSKGILCEQIRLSLVKIGHYYKF